MCRIGGSFLIGLLASSQALVGGWQYAYLPKAKVYAPMII